MKIISISGLDGSGKSTQIELLKEYFQARGKKVFYFHAVAFSIANKHSCHSECSVAKSKNLSARSLDYARDDKNSKSVTQASWTQIQLRKIALFIDIIRFKKLLNKLEKEGYDFILSDRYFYDSLVNIAYLESKNNTRYKIQNTRYKQIVRPEFPFYLNADPEKIMQRPRPADQGLDYLVAKKKILDEFSRNNKLIEINGNRSQQEVFEEIIAIIKK